MNITYSFKNFSDQEKLILEKYLEEKLPALERLVAHFSSPPSTLEVRAEKFTKKNAFNISFHLKTTRGTLLASEDDHTIAEAVDLAKDKLARQLRRK